MKTRKIFLILMLALSVLQGTAQQDNNHGGKGQKGHFDPIRFEAQMEKFVVTQAGITQQESARFLPIYREMRKKHVEAMHHDRESRKNKPLTEKQWEERLKAHDAMQVQLKKIAQTYHNKMLRVIPASKVVKVSMAENRFHRDFFSKMYKKDKPGQDATHKKRNKSVNDKTHAAKDSKQQRGRR